MSREREKLEILLAEHLEPERFTTDSDECVLYSRDMAPLPSLALMIFKTTPGAVVKPQTTKDVLNVIRLAAAHDIPVIPRGAATYGFGGALATKAGIIIDLRSMDKIRDLDKESNVVTVQSGVTWLKLNRYLELRSHALFTHPSSSPSATVAGWIATGGYGYGSLKYGHLADHIVELEVVLPSGRVVTSPSMDYPLELFVGTEGTFGVITQVKLRVRDLPQYAVSKLYSFEDEETLFDFIDETMGLIRDGEVAEPFSMIFSNSSFEELKQVVEKGHSTKPQVLFRFEGAEDEILDSIRVLSGLLGKHPTGHEYGENDDLDVEGIWEERFFPMSIRQLGPTLVGQDLFIPLEKMRELDKFLGGVSRRDNLKLSYEGMIVSPTSTVVLIMVLADERIKLRYLLSMPFLSDLGKEAVKLGGSPYGLGIWNSFYLDKYWDMDKANRLRLEKKNIDPDGLMNPDKVFGAKTRIGINFSKWVFHTGMDMLKLASPLKALSWKAKTPARGLDDVFEDLYMCSRCGYCAAVCPVFEELKSEQVALRGEIFNARRALEAGKMAPTESNVYLCTLCGRCKEYCSVRLNTLEIWGSFRKNSFDAGTYPEVLKTMTGLLKEEKNPMGMSYDSRLDWIDFRNKWNSRLIRRLSPEQKEAMRYSELDKSSLFKEKAKIVYFAGCSSSFYKRNTGIIESMARILGDANEDFALLGNEEWCCGEPFLLVGDVKGFKSFAEHNLELIKRLGAEKVVFTCAGCYNTFKKDYSNLFGDDLGVELLHSPELIQELFEEGKLNLGEHRVDLGHVTYHDPCEVGRHCGIYESPREVIEVLGLKFTEMEDNREEARCCGGGGLMKAVNQGLESTISLKRLKQAEVIGVDSIISSCPSCKMTLSEAVNLRGTKINIWDLAEVTAYSLGLIPPEIKRG